MDASVANGYCRIVSLLLQHGANANEMSFLNATSNSLWAIALAEGYPAIVKLLLRAGANPEKTPDLNRDFKLDNKMAMVLCSIDDNGRLQRSCKCCDTTYYRDNSSFIQSVLNYREPYKNHPELFYLYEKIQDLQYEMDDVDAMVQLVKERRELEQTPRFDMNRLRNLLKRESRMYLLEEDCAGLPAKRLALIEKIECKINQLRKIGLTNSANQLDQVSSRIRREDATFEAFRELEHLFPYPALPITATSTLKLTRELIQQEELLEQDKAQVHHKEKELQEREEALLLKEAQVRQQADQLQEREEALQQKEKGILKREAHLHQKEHQFQENLQHKLLQRHDYELYQHKHVLQRQQQLDQELHQLKIQLQQQGQQCDVKLERMEKHVHQLEEQLHSQKQNLQELDSRVEQLDVVGQQHEEQLQQLLLLRESPHAGLLKVVQQHGQVDEQEEQPAELGMEEEDQEEDGEDVEESEEEETGSEEFLVV